LNEQGPDEGRVAGARSDLVSLRSTSLRFHTVWDNQTRLRQAVEGITSDLVLPPEHQRLLEEGALLVRGRVSPDMEAAIQALRKLSNDCNDKIPPPLQSMQAVQGQLRALTHLQFTFSRRVLALCKSHLTAAVATLSGAQGAGKGSGGASSTGARGGQQLPLSGLHAELAAVLPLIDALIAVDVTAQDVLQGLYLKSLSGPLQQGLALVLQDVQKRMGRAASKEARLLHMPDASSADARAFLAQGAAPSGGLVRSRQGLCLLMAALKPALIAEEAFVARWLGAPPPPEPRAGADAQGGRQHEAAVRDRERAADRVLLQAFDALVARVVEIPEGILKHDALAAPAMLAHLAAAARLEQEAGAGGAGQVWRKVLYELRVKIRGRLWHYVELQVETLSQAPLASGKKVPAWVSKVPTLIQALLISHATPATPDSPGAQEALSAAAPIPRPLSRGQEQQAEAGGGDGREVAGGGKAGAPTLMDELCEKILTAALRCLGGHAAADPKYGSRLMLRA